MKAINYLQIISILVFGLVIPITPNTEAQNRDDPFLYYYSREQGAFIIERADGSDSYQLAEFSIPPLSSDEGQHIIAGPGWSPSGHWFAWYKSSTHGGVGEAVLINRNGDDQISILDGVDVADLKWSSINDLLLVITRATVLPPFIYSAYIIDMENPTSVLQIRDGIMRSTEVTHNYFDWTTGGHFVIEYYSDRDGSHGMEIISPDGYIEHRDIFRISPSCFSPAWSKEDKVAYINVSDKMLIVEDLRDKDIVRFSPPNGVIYKIDWSPNNDSALIFTAENCSEFQPNFDLYLLSVDTQTISLIAQNVAYHVLNSDIWSLDGDYGWITSTQNELFLLSVLPVSVNQVNRSTNGRILSPKWLADGRLGLLQLGEGGRTVELSVYDPKTGIVNLMFEQLPTISMAADFAFSENSRYVAIADGTLQIIDVQTGKIISIEHSPSSTYNSIFLNNISQIVWHSDDKWLLSWSSDPLSLITTVSVDGIQRDLTICSISASCFGWLPDLIN